jgi:hypothetical protein
MAHGILCLVSSVRDVPGRFKVGWKKTAFRDCFTAADGGFQFTRSMRALKSAWIFRAARCA